MDVGFGLRHLNSCVSLTFFFHVSPGLVMWLSPKVAPHTVYGPRLPPRHISWVVKGQVSTSSAGWNKMGIPIMDDQKSLN